MDAVVSILLVLLAAGVGYYVGAKIGSIHAQEIVSSAVSLAFKNNRERLTFYEMIERIEALNEDDYLTMRKIIRHARKNGTL